MRRRSRVLFWHQQSPLDLWEQQDERMSARAGRKDLVHTDHDPDPSICKGNDWDLRIKSPPEGS